MRSNLEADIRSGRSQFNNRQAMNLEDDANNRLVSMTDAAVITAFDYTGRWGQTSGSVLSIRGKDGDLLSLRNTKSAQIKVFTNDGAARSIARSTQHKM